MACSFCGRIHTSSKLHSARFRFVQITPQDQFLVLACDGVFDVLTSEEVVSNVYEKMKIHADAQRFDGF